MADNENKSQEELKRELEEDLRNESEEQEVKEEVKAKVENDAIIPTDERVAEINKSMAEESGLLEHLAKNKGINISKTSMKIEEDPETGEYRGVEVEHDVDAMIPEEEKKDFELNIDYVEGLYKTMFMNRMMEERARIIAEKMQEEKERLKNEDISYFERRKREKDFEKSLYEDYHSVEKKLAEQRKEAIKRQEELEKKIKQTGNLNQAAIQEKKQLETEYMLGDTLDSYIQAAYMSNKVQDKLKDKFPDVAKKLDADVMGMSDQHKYENKNLRRADGITKQFNKEFPEAQKEVNGFMAKLKGFAARNQKAIKTAGMILTGVGLVTNLPATAAVLGFNAIMKTKVMENVKKNIANDISNGLDKLGIDKKSKLRTGLKRVAVVAGLGVGVAVGLAAGNVDMSEITKLGGEALGGLTEGIDGMVNTEGLTDATDGADEAAKQAAEEAAKQEAAKQAAEEAAKQAAEDAARQAAYEEAARQLAETQQATTEFLQSNSEGITDSLFDQEMSDREWSRLEDKLGVDKENLQKLVEENIQKQIAEGTFPKAIELELNSYDGRNTHTINFGTEKMEQTANMLAQEQGKDIAIDSLSQTEPEIKEPEVKEPEPKQPENQPVPDKNGMIKVEVQDGEILTGMLEKVDSAEFDLVGADLPAVAQLIAEQNNIPDANRLLPGQMINMPSDTEALKNLVENNQERIQEIIKEQAQQAQQQTQQVAQQAVEQTISLPSSEFLNANSEDITKSLFKQEMSNSDWSRLEDKLGVDKRELQELVQENIQKQIAENTFPKTIELDLKSYNGRYTETVTFESSQIEKTVNFIAQEAGVQNNNVAINYDDTKIESSNQPVEKQEGVKQKKGMKLS